eukprot:1157669-Pelagomonas_calceolata.AAC.8
MKTSIGSDPLDQEIRAGPVLPLPALHLNKGGLRAHASPCYCTSLAPLNSCSHLQSIGAHHHHGALQVSELLWASEGDVHVGKGSSNLDMARGVDRVPRAILESVQN